MAGFVWKLRCALLCAKFFSVLKDTTSSPKTYRDFQQTDSSKGFSYKYSVHPLSSKTKTNLQVEFDSESMADEESLSRLLIIYMYLSNYRIYLFIYYFFFSGEKVKAKRQRRTKSYTTAEKAYQTYQRK